MIHNSKRLQDVQRLQYLKANLTGAAAKVIARTSLTDANYSTAWEALERRYGGIHVLTTAHIGRLLDCPAVKRASKEELTRVLDEFCQARDALAALKKSVETWDDWFVTLLVRKLDSTTRLDWRKCSRIRRPCRHSWRFETFSNHESMPWPRPKSRRVRQHRPNERRCGNPSRGRP